MNFDHFLYSWQWLNLECLFFSCNLVLFVYFHCWYWPKYLFGDVAFTVSGFCSFWGKLELVSRSLMDDPILRVFLCINFWIHILPSASWVNWNAAESKSLLRPVNNRNNSLTGNFAHTVFRLIEKSLKKAEIVVPFFTQTLKAHISWTD